MKTLSEALEVARKSLELRKTDLQQLLEEFEELKEANAKAEADRIRETDLEREKTSENTTWTWRKQTGSEESSKDRSELEKTGIRKGGRTQKNNNSSV